MVPRLRHPGPGAACWLIPYETSLPRRSRPYHRLPSRLLNDDDNVQGLGHLSETHFWNTPQCLHTQMHKRTIVRACTRALRPALEWLPSSRCLEHRASSEICSDPITVSAAHLSVVSGTPALFCPHEVYVALEGMHTGIDDQRK